MADVTYKVTVVEKDEKKVSFRFDGGFADNQPLSMDRGKTYKFDQSDVSNLGVVFKFSNRPDGQGLYTTGVTIVGTPGTPGAFTQIKVAATGPTKVYYFGVGNRGIGGEGYFQRTEAVKDNLAFGHYLTLRTATEVGALYSFQNYWVGEEAPFVNDSNNKTHMYGFLPFSFSGVTVTKVGDNQPATLAFPNNQLSRNFATVAVQDEYIAHVRTVLINPDNKAGYKLINRYIGQIVSAKWESRALTLQLAAVFDAVGADVPRKRLNRQLVGHLPLTGSVRVT